MAIRTAMTWQPDRARWRKMYRRKWFFVTCKDLNVPPTKEASYLAANAWWQSRRTELDGQNPPHYHHRAIAEIRQRLDWAKSHGKPELVRALQDIAEMIADDRDGDLQAHVLLNPSVQAGAAWDERLGGQEATPLDKTIAGHVVRFLEMQMSRHNAQGISASEYDLTRLCLNHFAEFIGPGNVPNVITPDRWESYWLHLSGELAKGKASAEYSRKRQRYAKTFIGWLASKGVIPVPSNLHDRRYKFVDVSKTVKVFTAEQARELVERAPGQLKLHLLLMLNTGMTQKDLSDLQHDEVDWQAGRIIRRRSKTRHHAHVPVVSYKLWPETLRLLNAFRTQSGERVLLTLKGKPWVQDGIAENGTYGKRDGINSNFRHLNPPLPLKTFRATSSTLLDGHREFSRFARHFLGHAGRSVAEKHYLNRDGSFAELFDEAVAWLGAQYGF